MSDIIPWVAVLRSHLMCMCVYYIYIYECHGFRTEAKRNLTEIK